MYCQQPWEEIQRIYLDSYIFLLADFKVERWGDDVGPGFLIICKKREFCPTMENGGFCPRGICPKL